MSVSHHKDRLLSRAILWEALPPLASLGGRNAQAEQGHLSFKESRLNAVESFVNRCNVPHGALERRLHGCLLQ